MIVVAIKMLIDNAINQTVAAIMKVKLDFNNHQIVASRRARFVRTSFITSQSLIVQGFSSSHDASSHFENYSHTNEIIINR